MWDPGNFRINLRVAELYSRRGHCSTARGYARQAVSLFPAFTASETYPAQLRVERKRLRSRSHNSFTGCRQCASARGCSISGIPFRTLTRVAWRSRSKIFTRRYTERDSASELRLLYQLYEEAQALRIAHGERLRAILQGRSFSELVTSVDDADPLLKAIGKGETAGDLGSWKGPTRALWTMKPPLLPRFARRSRAIRHGRGFRTSRDRSYLLSARLLSRLDVTRAETPSAFWAYCGLGTIPGVAYRCRKCNLEVAYPVGYESPDTHCARRWTARVHGRFRRNRRQAAYARCSASERPRRTRELRRPGAHFMLSDRLVDAAMPGATTGSFYDAARARLAVSRTGWTPKRCHLSALRRMEKTFLRDLWIAWRTAENLTSSPPYYPRIQPETACAELR